MLIIDFLGIHALWNSNVEIIRGQFDLVIFTSTHYYLKWSCIVRNHEAHSAVFLISLQLRRFKSSTTKTVSNRNVLAVCDVSLYQISLYWIYCTLLGIHNHHDSTTNSTARYRLPFGTFCVIQFLIILSKLSV